MWIREETGDDLDAIRDVVRRAFVDAPGEGRLETRIVDALRADGALSVSLVAAIDGRIAGHAGFSPAHPARAAGDWYVLAPVAVAPADQGHGVGTALVSAGLRMLRERGARGCVVLGDPAYYARFGFRATPGFTLAGAPDGAFQALPFDASADEGGEVVLHPVFGPQPDPD
ncbi:GNAT family N-acetyltransferase [Luteimonas abyssi]|uniref:GNAT family N-acetyltransferase n=1 Tax=Luteimonas abyssi TaxID=1247514 RepID=UPI000737C4B9|nr:N-acetyltransferase [Luteimonas abyssi]